MASLEDPLALTTACHASTAEWQLHLEQLFNNARDRFPDVVWELVNEGDPLPTDEVWGHKAMVYARAPPTFQARYFSFRPPPIASPSPYGPSPMPAQSAVSLSAMSLAIDLPSPARSPSPNGIRTHSPAPTIPGQLMRLTTTIASALFSQELEFLYTGKSFGDAFEFLFDSPEKRDEGDGEKNRLEKLRKDLVFMWRSRLYSDVRIQLSGNLSSTSTHDDPTSTAVFSSHRFILVSRSPYFRSQLLGPFASPVPQPNQPITLTLPSPPFTPASLHFTLGYIYTGTLSFSHRTFDLDTAFHIMRAATYLSMSALYAEIEARIIEEMMHGLFHAYLPFDEYEKITGGKWGVSGDKCRQCARRAPRVLEFAVLEDVKNDRLTNGARRALVGLFGDGWCTSEFASLPQKTRDSLLRGVQKRTVPLNVFPLLYAAQHAMARLNSVMDPWAHTVREMVLGARKAIDDLMCDKAEECFQQSEWLSVMDADGGRFEDGEKVEWVMDCLRRGLNEKNAGMVYQTIVSSILLRPHPEDPNATLLSNTSGIRQQVEMTRMDVIKWMRRRWAGVHQEGGFDNLEGWALKELSHELEVPVEDLLRPSPASLTKGPPTRTGLRPSIGKPEGDGDTASMTSLRASVLNRKTTKSSVVTTPTSRDTLASSATSIRSVRTTASRASKPRTSTASLTQPSPAPSVRAPSRASKKSVTSPERPKSVAASVRSHASTIRKTSAPTPVPAAGPSTLRASRPASTMSTRSEASTAFKTAQSEVNTNRVSVASSSASTSRGGSKTPTPRVRRGSGASATSIASSIASTASTKKSGSNAKKADKAKLVVPPVPKRPASTMSNVSTTNTNRAAAAAKAAAAKANERRESIGRLPPPVPAVPQKNGATPKNAAAPAPPTTVSAKAKGKVTPAKNEPARPVSNAASEVSTVKARKTVSRGGVLRKASNDTVITNATAITTDTTTTNTTTTSATTSTTTTTSPSTPRALNPTRAAAAAAAAPPQQQQQERGPPSPKPPPHNLGATLNVGIPCIISSKRSRFRAFARYIGELEGQPGSWVGVEVPVGDTWGADKLEGRSWNDGSWGGRRYFDIGSAAEWEEGEERRRKRRREGSGGPPGGGGVSREKTLKREGEQLNVGDRSKRLRSLSPAASDVSASTELRGLFVRPQEVIYVVDAESDL